MKTLTFREPELLELIEQEDAKSEWHEIVKRLGMMGQLEHVEKDGTPNPYQRLNSRWVKILKVVCPAAIEFKKFNHSTIPLDVLKEIEFAVQNNFFREIQVWWSEKEKDPFVVGISGEQFRPKHHLIAQWGEELLPFELLENKAIESLSNHISRRLDFFNQKESIIEGVNAYLDRDVNPMLVDTQTAHGRLIVY